jgi:hypothetical protein
MQLLYKNIQTIIERMQYHFNRYFTNAYLSLLHGLLESNVKLIVKSIPLIYGIIYFILFYLFLMFFSLSCNPYHDQLIHKYILKIMKCYAFLNVL